MTAQQQSPSVVVGSVAAAATAGALVAMGRRFGSGGFPFAAMSSGVLHRTVSGGSIGLVLIGVGLHVALMFVWAIVFVWLSERLAHREGIAALAVAIAHFATGWLIARSAGIGLASVLPLGDRLVFALVMVGALVMGMRLARVSLQNA